jgi:hypothetical protein
MMVSIAHMLAKKVRVNSVLIGTVMTEGYSDAGIDAAMQEKLRHPDNLTGRPGKPEDVANAMLWLCLAGERLGERPDDQCSWRRRRGAPVRQVRLMGRNAVRPALAVLAMAALAGGDVLAQESSTHPSNLPQSMQADGVPVESVSVQLRTSGGSPEQDAAALAVVRKLGAALEGEPFSAIVARRAVARMEREAGVRKVDYRLLPQGANAVRIQFLVDAAPGRKEGEGVPSGILTGELADFPVFYKDDRKLVTAIVAGGLGVYSDGNAWFGKP